MRRTLPLKVALVLAATLWSALSFGQVKVPTHRGPLTQKEMKAVVRDVRAAVAPLSSAAQRVRKAKEEGRPYQPRKYQVIEDDPIYGGTVVTRKGVPATEQGLRGNDHALISGAGIHVQMHLSRRESGKPGANELSVRLNPGQRITAGRPGKTMLLYETRTSGNGRAGEARHTMRSYRGPSWSETHVSENDGNGKRAGEKVGFHQKKTLYGPGGRMGVWDPSAEKTLPVKNKKMVE